MCFGASGGASCGSKAPSMFTHGLAVRDEKGCRWRRSRVVVVVVVVVLTWGERVARTRAGRRLADWLARWLAAATACHLPLPASRLT